MKQYLGHCLLWILKMFPLSNITVNLAYPLQTLPFFTEEEIQNEKKATPQSRSTLKRKVKLTEY